MDGIDIPPISRRRSFDRSAYSRRSFNSSIASFWMDAAFAYSGPLTVVWLLQLGRGHELFSRIERH